MDRPLPGLQESRRHQSFHHLFLHFIIAGVYGFTVTHRPVQLEVKGQGIVDDKKIQAGQWIWTSHKRAQLLDAPSYQRFLLSVPVDLACGVIQWAYVKDMGRWSEGDLLISMDLDNGSYCNGDYGVPVIRGWP